MRGIAQQEDTALRVGGGGRGMKGVDDAARNLRGKWATGLTNHFIGPSRLRKVGFCLAGQQHKFPAASKLWRWDGDGWTSGIAEEFDGGGRVGVLFSVEDQPFLGVG